MIRALEAGALDGSQRTGAPVAPLWVLRSEALELLRRHPSPLRAGREVWSACEPWVQSVRALASEPAVLLAEVGDWLALLDRHSTVQLEGSQAGSRLLWRNLPAAAPDVRECALRQGALSGLLDLGRARRGLRVRHPQCAARGSQECVFAVDQLAPRADPAHARALREAALLSAALQGREDLFRRMARWSASRDPFPDVRELRAVRRFMEDVEDVVIVFDRDLAVLDANQATVEFSGINLPELRGLSARDLMSPESYHAVHQYLPLLFERGALRGLTIDGRTREGWIKMEVSARVSEDREVIVCIGRDVEERLRLEQELAERNQRLEEQNQRISAADRLKSEFLANVSHELTTPLTCIKGFARLLLGDLEGELRGDEVRLAPQKRIEFLRVMERESERMTDLIRGLLELSKIESGVVSLDRARVSLNTIVRETLVVLKPRLDERGLAVDLRLDGSLPASYLDPDRMKQVVLNLLDNAIKFSDPGSSISILTGEQGGCLRLAIRNPTHDLGDDDLGRIFERFVQRDGSFARPQSGVGLGLNLVRAIVGLHGGRVWAELRGPGEAEFVAEIPLAFR